MEKLCKDIVILNLNKGYAHSSDHMVAFIHTDTYSVVTEQNIIDCYDKIKDKTYSPTAKDKLYFYPNCTVPRFKIREMWKPKKVSVTIKEDNGTHKFLNANRSKYTDNLSNIYKVPVDVITTWFKSMDPLFEKYNLDGMRYENLTKEILNCLNNEEHIYINYQFDCVLDDRGTNTLYGKDSAGSAVGFPPIQYNNLPMVEPYESPSSVDFQTIKEDKVITAFEDIFSGNDSDYYLDEAVNRALQDESTVIDEDMYAQLKNLFKADDESNHTMAMEVMANANVAKSAKFIYRLFRTFNDKLIYNSAYDSVNFKALVETTGLRKYASFNDDNYIKFMHKYGQLDIDTVKEIREKACRAALQAVKREFKAIIEDGVVEIDFPIAKVVLKGVNDGSSDIIFVDEAEEAAVKEADNNPAQYSNDYVPPAVAPCVAHAVEMEDETEVTDSQSEDETTDVEVSSPTDTMEDSTELVSDDTTEGQVEVPVMEGQAEEQVDNTSDETELSNGTDTGDVYDEALSNEESDEESDKVSEENVEPVVLSEEDENAELAEKYGHLYVPKDETAADLEAQEMKTEEIIENREDEDQRCETAKEIFPGTMDELEEIKLRDEQCTCDENPERVCDTCIESDHRYDEQEEVKVQDPEGTRAILEDCMEEFFEEQKEKKESVFEPIAQAIKPETNDDWWETSETTTSNDADPFA
jgi:hypothetical protein